MNDHQGTTDPYAVHWAESTRSWPWKALLLQALALHEGEASVADLYKALATHPRISKAGYWQNRIRRILELDAEFVRVREGVWGVSWRYSQEQLAQFAKLNQEKASDQGIEGAQTN